MNLKRPKRLQEEDEDDLLEFQRQFLQNKTDQPAAKVVRHQTDTEQKPQTNPIPESTKPSISNLLKEESKPKKFDCIINHIEKIENFKIITRLKF